MKVDFDLAMTIAAHNFYRLIAQDLAGFERETSCCLNAKFFNNGGQGKIQDDSIIVEMKKKRHLPLLIESLLKYKNEYLFSAYSAIKILYLGDSAIEIGIQGHTPDQVRGKLVDLSQM